MQNCGIVAAMGTAIPFALPGRMRPGGATADTPATCTHVHTEFRCSAIWLRPGEIAFPFPSASGRLTVRECDGVGHAHRVTVRDAAGVWGGMRSRAAFPAPAADASRIIRGGVPGGFPDGRRKPRV
jgi:hypothetical protein